MTFVRRKMVAPFGRNDVMDVREDNHQVTAWLDQKLTNCSYTVR